MSKERAIPFYAHEVRAILEGRKTQTRRLIGVQVLPPVHRWKCVDGLWHALGKTPKVERQFATTWPDPVRCPYGQPGDRLWVRETWQTSKIADAKSPKRMAIDAIGSPELIPIRYADGAIRARFDTRDVLWGKGRPSIHMPRCASRITLEITGVRVERLQDISESDAIAEGLTFRDQAHGPRFWCGRPHPADPDGERMKVFYDPRQAFESLWDWINGDRAAWASNPWVWVVEFKRVQP